MLQVARCSWDSWGSYSGVVEAHRDTHRIHGAGIYIYILTLGVYWWDPCYHIYHTWIRHGIGNSSLNCFRTSTGRSGVRMPHFEMFLALEMPLLCLSINMVVKNKWSCRDAVAQWFMSFHWNMDPHHIIYTSIDHQLYRHSSLPSGKLT